MEWYLFTYYFVQYNAKIQFVYKVVSKYSGNIAIVILKRIIYNFNGCNMYSLDVL